MGKTQEALKSALAGLVKATQYGFGEFEEEKSAISSAIQRLKLAEQPVHQHIEHCLWARNGNTPCPHVQPAPVAEPHKQQEPVAIHQVYLDGGWADRDESEMWVYSDADVWETRVVYTSPPANTNAGKPWMGLTDEQIGMAFRKAFPVGGVVFTNGAIDFARAIEAKLREKNA